MAAVAHNPKFAKRVKIPQSVGREFYAADKRLGRYADGGRVLPSSTDDEEPWSDTYIKRPLSGLASVWGGTDPETGEFVSPLIHNLKRAWYADERRRQGLPRQGRAIPGIVDETISLPALGGIVGLPVPTFAEKAEERASDTRRAARETLGLDAPHGFKENIAESAGVMLGQVPIPASIADKLKLIKNPSRLSKIAGPAAEWFMPTVVPKASNYIKGALFGGVLGGALDHINDRLSAQEAEERNRQWIAEAMDEVLTEEGSEETDDAALAELGYAEGGAVAIPKKNHIFIPEPQSQKESATADSRGVPLSQEWYENYGSGPEHLFLGDRTVKLHDMWSPQHPSQPPVTTGRPDGSWLPAAGILGFSLYDEWKKRQQAGQDTSQQAFWQNIHDSAAGTTDTDAWVNQQLDEYSQNAPIPQIGDDGSVTYIQPSQFWRDMHRSAIDTTDTDAWIEGQLDEYGQNMPVPHLNDDGTISYTDSEGNPVQGGGLNLGNAWQGAQGAFGLYSGLEQGGVGGYAQALQGADDLYGAFAGDTGMLGQAAGTVGGLASLYGGLQQGGIEGYTQAASGAIQTANQLGFNTASGALGVAGKAIPLVGGALSAYGAYESAKVGDKKGAVSQGAAAGAAIGSVIPVIGTAVGAVIGAAVGLVGAAFGDKENPSELAYGAHKKLDRDQNTRGWSEDQINGAVFETIKSHTKSGKINKFTDVQEMYKTFGINNNAHKNYKNVQTQMGSFIQGVIETAQQMGALPTDPVALRQLDGQKIFHKIVTPALAAKYKEVTGQDSQGWTSDRSAGSDRSPMHDLFADWTDWMISHWGKATPQAQPKASGLKGAMRGAIGRLA